MNVFSATTSAKHKTSPPKENKQLVDKSLIDECYDIRSLETLARLHIMIADMLEGISPKSLEYALIAVSCIQKLWQVRYFTPYIGVLSFICSHWPLKFLLF